MRPRNRRGFTLIEMLVVILLAVMLMSMGASAFNRLSETQKLSIGAGAVCAALQQARAHAIKTKQVTAVYFLDAGDCNPSNLDTNGKTSKFTTYDSVSKAKVPCELVIWSDGEAINNVKLPVGVAWLDVNSRPSDFTNENRPYYRRACSLVVNFAPSGSAWADILESDGGDFSATTTTGCRTKASCTNIRVFSVDLPNPSFSEVNSEESATTNKKKNSLFVGTVSVNYSADGKNVTSSYTHKAGNKKPALVYHKDNGDMRRITWITVHLNYQTGIAEMVNGAKETWTEP